MRFSLHHGPDNCILYLLIRCLYLVNIYDRWVFGYSIKHLCKTFRHTHFPLPLAPSPLTRLIWALAPAGKLKSRISQNDQLDWSPISRSRYLCRISTDCCQIFNIGKRQNYLGRKHPKFAIYEIFSLSQIRPEMQVNEMYAHYDNHHKVSYFLKSH